VIVVFDLDGTLIDQSEAIYQTYRAAFSAVSKPCPTRDDVWQVRALKRQEAAKALYNGLRFRRFWSVFRKSYHANAERYETPFRGVSDLLDHPFKAAIATARKRKSAGSTLRRVGLSGRFGCVLGRDSVPRGKPSPDQLFAISSRMKDPDLVMVGDTLDDLSMAKAAGVRAVGVSWGAHDPTDLASMAPVAETVDQLSEFLFGDGFEG